VAKYGRAGQHTDDNIIGHMGFAYWIARAIIHNHTHAHTHTHTYTLTHTHTLSHTHTHKQTLTRTNAHTHTRTHSHAHLYFILIAFPWQQWLRYHASMLPFLHVVSV